MKTTNRSNQSEKAQVLPIMAIALIVVIMFAAVIIDGGSIMVNRRTAQASADAGAMAGAREMCYSTGADPLVVAENYALLNEAETANAQIVDGSIVVNTTVTNDSFFAKIFDENPLDANAEAIAGCYSPSGDLLMPFGWSCRPSLVDEAPFDPGLDCLVMGLDWAGLLKPLVDGTVSTIEVPGNAGYYEMDGDNIVNVSTGRPPKQIYQIMDSDRVNEETYCKEELEVTDPGYASAITCDLDGDGKYDIEGRGNRGWLDFRESGGGAPGAAQVKGWIENGPDVPIPPHTWLGAQPGVATSLFKETKALRQGDVVFIPVFNAICDENDPTSNSACMTAAHAFPLPAEPLSGDIVFGGKKPRFHIVAFHPFYISCVHDKNKDDCPGLDWAMEVNSSITSNNTKSIEGFFLTNVGLPLDLENQCGVNLGNCVVSLIK